jgi:flagellar hook assembly protein FlgD
VMIYNILGQQVRRLVSEEMDAGEHAVVWSGRDEGGSPVSSGIYFYTIQAGERFESKKMVMVR